MTTHLNPALIIGITSLLGIIIHLILPKGTHKNLVFIYCLVVAAIISGLAGFLNALNEFNDTPEYMASIVGTALGYAIGGGVLGGVIGYNIGNLLFGKRFIDKRK